MAKIIAPNKSYNGISAGIPFINGIGETNDPELINWFKEKGYRVEKETIPQPDNGQEYKIPDLEDMTAEELISFAGANNIKIGKTTDKQLIIKKIIAAGQPVGGDTNDNEG